MMKKIYIVLLVILIAGCSLCLWKWDTWFKNPLEAPYSTPHHQDRIILTVGENADNTRRINWRCGTMLTEAYVELIDHNADDTAKIPAHGNTIASRSGKSTFYNTELINLTTGHDYTYRVVNDTLHSAWYTFRIPVSDDSMSFIYLGDIQDPASGATSKIFQDIYQKYPDADFWALGGDVIERPTDAYWNYWFETMDSIAPQQAIIAATGNHEYLKGLPKTLDPRWTSTFSFPGNGPKDFEGRSYVLNFKDLCYIVIDTDGIQGPQSLYRHYAWLKDVLSSTTKKWKIIMMHHPVYSVRAHRNNFYVRYTFKPLMEKYNVDLVLQGHDHGYSRITTKNDNLRETPVYIVSSCSPKHYSIGFNPVHDRLGSGLALYQYITIKGDTLQYRSLTTDHEIYDDLKIINNGKTKQVIDSAINIPERLSLPESYLKNKKTDTAAYNKEVRQWLNR